MENTTTTTMQGETTQEVVKFDNDFFARLEAIPDSELKEIDLPILNFTEGEVNNLIAVEVTEKEFMDSKTGQREKKDCVIFQDSTGTQRYNGNAYIVNAIKQIKNSLPFPVRIVCTGSKKGANGVYKTFSVKTLQ